MSISVFIYCFTIAAFTLPGKLGSGSNRLGFCGLFEGMELLKYVCWVDFFSLASL